jgi:hypothetical protein
VRNVGQRKPPKRILGVIIVAFNSNVLAISKLTHLLSPCKVLSFKLILYPIFPNKSKIRVKV